MEVLINGKPAKEATMEELHKANHHIIENMSRFEPPIMDTKESKHLLQIIKHLYLKYGGRPDIVMIPEEEICMAAEEEGLVNIADLIQELKQKGEIFEAKRGFISVI